MVKIVKIIVGYWRIFDNCEIYSKAESLVQEGYLVVAPDTLRGSTTAWISRAIYQVVTNKLIVADAAPLKRLDGLDRTQKPPGKTPAVVV